MPLPTDTLLRYRPWRGELRGPNPAAVAIARASLTLLFRRRLYWGLFALAALGFLFFFYGQYLMMWIGGQFTEGTVRVGTERVPIADLKKFLDRLGLDGSAHTFGNFVWFQGYALVITLAFAGSVLVGNDFAHGSLPFYLSKPIGRWHYVAGKCLAVGAFINLMTTLPALVLFAQAGLLADSLAYYTRNLHLLLGVLGYGAALTACLGLLLVATAVWLRRTAPLAVVWMGVFGLLPRIAQWMVDGLKFDERWRLIDLWNDLYLVGMWCLRADPQTLRPQPQPGYGEAALAVAAVCVASLLYLRRRIRAVEIVA